MDNRTLENFLHLADTLHFGKAAENCHLSPSALSRSIKRLEEAVGKPLFERDNRRVNLTREGEMFRRYAEDVLQRWHTLEASIHNKSGNLQGQISLYCSVTASYSILSEVFAEFRRRHPGIEIKLHTGDQAEAIPRVLAGKDDLVIAARPEKLANRLSFQTITESPLLFIAPILPCAVRDLVSEYHNNLQNIPWEKLPLIVAEHGLIRTRLDDWCRAKRIKPHLYAQVSGNEAIVSMVGLGCGVGVVPELVIKNSPLWDKVQLLKFRPSLAPLEIGISTPRKRLEDPLVKAFWDVATEAPLAAT